MKCPKCKDDMLSFPILQDHKVLSYWLCLNCMHRIIIHCKWRVEAKIVLFNWIYWCLKMDEPCNVKSEPCGYQRCSQIREWDEEIADWVKKSNREFEKKERKEKKALFKKAKEVYNATQKNS